MEVKRCRLCGRGLPLSCFYKHRGTTDGHRGECKECHSKRSKEYYREHKAEHRTVSRRYSIKKLYGITEEDFNNLYESQGGKCAICGKPLDMISANKNNAAHIDHDHETGKVRGILCRFCNIGLGLFKDNLELLDRAKEYLAKSKAI